VSREKVVSKWRTKVDEKRQDKQLSKDRADQPPKLVKANKTSSNVSSESAAKKWLSKSKVGSGAHHPVLRQPPSSATSKWTTARSRTLAVNRLNGLAKQAAPPSLHHSGKPAPGTHNTRGNLLQSSGSVIKAGSLQSSLANRPSSLQTKPFLPSSSAPSKLAPGPKTNWHKAAARSKAVTNFSKPATASSTVGVKKPFVPYKSSAKPGLGTKPGLSGAGKRGPVKLGGGKMGGKFF